MKKWLIALVSGFILFILIFGGMVVFSHCMAVKVRTWEEAGMTLSTLQIFALQFSFFFKRYWFFISPIILLLCLGVTLIIAAMKKKKIQS